MKKSTLSRDSTYISAVFAKKIIIITLGLVPKRVARKTAKNTEKRRKSDFNARSQANHTTYTQTFDVCGKRPLISCYRKRFHGKILKTH